MHRFYPLFLLVFLSCNNDQLPKPRAFLNLEYSIPQYTLLDIERPYNFEIPKHTRIKDEPRNWLKVLYPKQRASVDITYLKVNDNLRELILESEKLVFEHTVKADQISSNDYIDLEKRVFGTFYEITGDAASQIQFHLTDSTHHFLKGALYFRTKPNYDSILPAMAHIKKDVLRIMETLDWK